MTLSTPDFSAAPRVFQEPWEAHVFAIVVMLHERGLFSWKVGAETLSGNIAQAAREGDPDLGETYYSHWLNALESIVAMKGASNTEELALYSQEWDAAAERTPHAEAIELKTVDFARA